MGGVPDGMTEEQVKHRSGMCRRLRTSLLNIYQIHKLPKKELYQSINQIREKLYVAHVLQGLCW